MTGTECCIRLEGKRDSIRSVESWYERDVELERQSRIGSVFRRSSFAASIPRSHKTKSVFTLFCDPRSAREWFGFVLFKRSRRHEVRLHGKDLIMISTECDVTSPMVAWHCAIGFHTKVELDSLEPTSW